MTGLDLDAAQALTDAATEGPWVTDSTACCVTDEDREYYICERGEGEGRDAAFIAWARTGVPQLIARVRELERIVSAIQDLHASDSHPSLPCCPECLVPWPCKTGTTVRQNSTGQHGNPVHVDPVNP